MCGSSGCATRSTGHQALTLSSLCEAGLRSEIVNLERKRGEAFPKRAGDLKAGRPSIPPNDAWIAALARQHDLPIMSNDTHFDVVDGLQRIAF